MVPIRQLEVNADVLTDISHNSYALSITKLMSDVTSEQTYLAESNAWLNVVSHMMCTSFAVINHTTFVTAEVLHCQTGHTLLPKDGIGKINRHTEYKHVVVTLPHHVGIPLNWARCPLLLTGWGHGWEMRSVLAKILTMTSYSTPNHQSGTLPHTGSCTHLGCIYVFGALKMGLSLATRVWYPLS